MLKAANRYIAKVPNAGEGERNDAAFHLAGHLAAFMMKDTGEAIDEDDLLDLVRTWTEQNAPPLGDSELQHARTSAWCTGPARDAMLIQEASSTGNNDNAHEVPGSSFLWVGNEHKLNREEIAQLIAKMQHWLDTGRLPTTD